MTSQSNRCHRDLTGAAFVGALAPAQTRTIERYATEEGLNTVLLALAQGFGRQHWWPAATPFEVMIGAVLTQNTAWGNVELALAKLRKATALTPAALLALPASEATSNSLESLIRPSGSFRMKAKKLRALCNWFQALGDTTEDALMHLATQPLPPLRANLLSVFGVGPETADAILCYGAGRLTPVVDAYARRVLSRHKLGPNAPDSAGNTFPGGDAMTAPYEELRLWLLEVLVPDQAVYEEFHALFVAAGKDNCKVKSACDTCPALTPDKLLA